MSVHVSTDVWAYSRAKGGALLVLLAIADHANDEGSAYPSIASLATKTRTSERQVQANIAQLVELGELQIERGGGRKHTNLYQITVKPTSPFIPETVKPVTPFTPVALNGKGEVFSIKGEVSDIETGERVKFPVERVKPTSPEPSLETSPPTESSEESSPYVSAVADVLVDARFVGDEYETVRKQVAKSLTRVEGFDARDGPLQADLFVGYYTTGKGSKKQPSNWYTAWLNWIKKAVEYERRDTAADRQGQDGRATGGGGGVVPQRQEQDDIERRGYSYDRQASIRAAG